MPNFSIKTMTAKEQDELDVVTTMRHAEIAEQVWLSENVVQAEVPVEEEEEGALGGGGEGDAKGGADAAAEGGDADGSDGGKDDEDDEDDDEEGGGSGEGEGEDDILYKPRDLTTSRRKRFQIVLLNAKLTEARPTLCNSRVLEPPHSYYIVLIACRGSP